VKGYPRGRVCVACDESECPARWVTQVMVMLLSSVRGCQCTLLPGFHHHIRNAGGVDRTTRRPRTHNPEIREVHYRWHPWYGCRVSVIHVVERRAATIYQCSLEDSDDSRTFEIPQWMCDDHADRLARSFREGPGSADACLRNASGLAGSRCGASWIQRLSGTSSAIISNAYSPASAPSRASASRKSCKRNQLTEVFRLTALGLQVAMRLWKSMVSLEEFSLGTKAIRAIIPACPSQPPPASLRALI
jgi:hypothetical protein